VRRRGWALVGTAAMVVAVVIGGVVVLSGGEQATSAAARAAPASTATVQRGKLSAAVSQSGTLTYRARPDGSPYSVINQAHGVYTKLPDTGDKVACGGVLYRVDEQPVLLLCGTVPAYRALHVGDAGQDVHQLNRNLHVRGAGDAFTTATETALEALQRRRGVHVDGSLALGDAVFLPEALRIAKVTAELGAAARPGALALTATSDTLHVQVSLAPSDQGQVERGDRAQITLPGNATVTGKVAGFGRIAQAPAGQDGGAAEATIPTSISLNDPRKARGLDRAPVQVDITTKGVKSALSVPVTALVGKAGGGFAVEVVRAGERRDLVAVRVGLFDTAAGRVQVAGDLREGDRVAVPSL
jgi:multidrug efflux pump subunit AcrA (membrane-fusion protein)